MLLVRNLQVYFYSDERVVKAVDGISFDLARGETVCLVGESGCGKSVSALAIMGLLPHPAAQIAGGQILFREQDLLLKTDEEMRAIRGNRIAMVFQEPMTSLNPVFTIGDQIQEAILTHERQGRKDLTQRCINLLRDVGIPSPEERLRDYPHQLSGGQRQRVMIAMALACNPELVIADEPTTALDVTIQAQILELFKKMKGDREMSLFYITHDLSVVSTIADRIYVMYAGVMVEQGSREDIFRRPAHPYTRGLPRSLPDPSKRGRELYSIPGTVPDPAFKPPGCPFHPRCDKALESCGQSFPEMVDHGQGHLCRCPVLFAQKEEKGGQVTS